MASAYRDALEALFRAAGGSSWKEKNNWATDTELSAWYGVTVDKDDRVRVLALQNNNLRGIIGTLYLEILLACNVLDFENEYIYSIYVNRPKVIIS